MRVSKTVNIIGAVITIGFGLLGLLLPAKASELTGLHATTKSAYAEFRGTFGGAFVVMGVVPLLVRQPVVFLTAGLFWWGAAAGRLVSMLADGGFDDPQNLSGLLIEGVFGLLLVLGNTSRSAKQA